MKIQERQLQRICNIWKITCKPLCNIRKMDSREMADEEQMWYTKQKIVFYVFDKLAN